MCFILLQHLILVSYSHFLLLLLLLLLLHDVPPLLLVDMFILPFASIAVLVSVSSFLRSSQYSYEKRHEHPRNSHTKMHDFGIFIRCSMNILPGNGISQ